MRQSWILRKKKPKGGRSTQRKLTSSNGIKRSSKTSKSWAKRALAAAPSDPIKHVAVLMLENRSFNQMLGSLKEVYPNLDGIDTANLQSNSDLNGRSYRQEPTNWTTLQTDPPHEHNDVMEQFLDANGRFVRVYHHKYPASSTDQRQQIMSYYPRGLLSALHQLGENFTVCDHWFSSVPGPTWPNRFYIHSGTSKGRVTMKWGAVNSGWYDQMTVFDRLNERNVSWKVYYGDVAQSMLLKHQYSSEENSARYWPMREFYYDAGRRESEFPQYAFIEPAYFLVENDDHPPSDIILGEQLIAEVYNAIRRNESLWDSTLLVVLYDEHGGFYDSVQPPTAIAPDGHKEDGFDFKRLGVRVPALLVSPWVNKGVITTQFDHTSLLRYLSEKEGWKLGSLGERTAKANSFDGAFMPSPRTNTPPFVSVKMAPHPDPTLPPETMRPLNDHQKGLVEFCKFLEKQIDEEPTLKTARARQIEASLGDNQIEAAITAQRFALFVKQQRRKAERSGP